MSCQEKYYGSLVHEITQSGLASTVVAGVACVWSESWLYGQHSHTVHLNSVAELNSVGCVQRSRAEGVCGFCSQKT